MIEGQLLLGAVAALAWAGSAIRLLRGSVLGPRGVVAAGVCIASALVILIFGSLYLLGIADAAVWFVTGTLLRLVVAISGLVALVDQFPSTLLVDYLQTAEQLRTERSASIAHLGEAIAENTRISQGARDDARAAVEAANNVNEKIATQGEAIVEQAEAAAADRLVGTDTNATAHRIEDRAS